MNSWLNVVLFAGLGALLGGVGFGFHTWQYWSIMGLVLAIYINGRMIGHG